MSSHTEPLIAARTAAGPPAPPRSGSPDTTGNGARHSRGRWWGRVQSRVRRIFWPLVLLNAIIALTLAAGPLLHLWLGSPVPRPTGPLLALSCCVVWALSFFPGWLFVRFLDRRAGVLWDEYVLNLHRLGLDEPGNLPEPPVASSYHLAWELDHGPDRLHERNVYQEKFAAYYGRSVAGNHAGDRTVKAEALFPVFLCTALLAVGWTAALYDPRLTFGAEARGTAAAALAFAFLGAYVYFVQMLMRRYFQADLRAGAYVSGYVRVVSALVVVTALWAVLPHATAPAASTLAAVAFVVGWFPDVGLRALFRFAARRLRGFVPSLEPAYPLNRLDGLNVWYEARLLEEGIEDLENLVSANLVDVLLHTRVPVARLVDWLDQAILLIHLPAEPVVVDQSGLTHKTRAANATQNTARHPRQALRKCGIRSASDLLRALSEHRDPQQRQQLVDVLKDDMEPGALLSLYCVLHGDARVPVVFNWQRGDARYRTTPVLQPVQQPGAAPAGSVGA
jgi:hypothetical protein